MKSGVIMGMWILLMMLIGFVIVFYDKRSMEDESLFDRVALLEKQMEQKTVPRIYVARGTVYAGGSEVVIEEIDVKEEGR